MITTQAQKRGWDDYARTWDGRRAAGTIPDLAPGDAARVGFVGDEWCLMEGTSFPYGVGVGTVGEFLDYIDDRLLTPHLPPGDDLTLMEIGPGGGRITQLLLPRCRKLYAVDVSGEMLGRLRARFPDEPRIHYIETDGLRIEGVPPAGLDAVVSFDTFVHLQPAAILKYLDLVGPLLRPGGIGLIHFSDVETPIGLRLFRAQVEALLDGRDEYCMFSAMSKGIFRSFLSAAGLQPITINNDALPRDAVAVFRRFE